MTAPLPPVPVSPARVRALLAALGDTPEAVAATLLAGGHRGDPGSACGCPVAVYLRSEGVEYAEVDGNSVAWDAESVLAPTAIGDFVVRFDGDDDEGEWPELRIPCNETPGGAE